jgi:hypothetical protein
MADEGVPHSGQDEQGLVEMTRIRSPPERSLTAVISRPSGNGISRVVGIPGHLHHIFALECSRFSELYQSFTTKLGEPFL